MLFLFEIYFHLGYSLNLKKSEMAERIHKIADAAASADDSRILVFWDGAPTGVPGGPF